MKTRGFIIIGGVFMNLKIREANMKDYIELNALVAEVH